MDLNECVDAIRRMFDPATLIPDEFGVTCTGTSGIRRIGYAANLTPETIASALNNEVDLIITHHDAWEFMYGMKAECVGLLNKHRISHVFAHLPLDAADFGTAASLGAALGAKVVDKVALYEGFMCGRICALPRPLQLTEFADRVQSVCEEKVCAWENSNRPVRTFGVVPGAGHLTSYVKECVDRGCELFMTGERNLYTVEYAQYAGIHLVVGSHTFTEIFGVEALVRRVTASHPDVQAVRLHESHVENAR